MLARLGDAGCAQDPLERPGRDGVVVLPPRERVPRAPEPVFAALLRAEALGCGRAVGQRVLRPAVRLSDAAHRGEQEVHAIPVALVRELALEVGLLEAEPLDHRAADALERRLGPSVHPRPHPAASRATAAVRPGVGQVAERCRLDDGSGSVLERRGGGIRDGQRLRGREDSGEVDHGVEGRGARSAGRVDDGPGVGAGVDADISVAGGGRPFGIEHVDVAGLTEDRQPEEDRCRLEAEHRPGAGEAEGRDAHPVSLPGPCRRPGVPRDVDPGAHALQSMPGERQLADLPGGDERDIRGRRRVHGTPSCRWHPALRRAPARSVGPSPDPRPGEELPGASRRDDDRPPW